MLNIDNLVTNKQHHLIQGALLNASIPQTFQSVFTKNKSYSFITSCVIEYIITTNALTCREKLYYLLADTIALINKNSGNLREFALPSEEWAKRLGCSRSLVFTMQSSLVKKGYFIINKDFDEIGRNKRNVITTTLPDSVFHYLNKKFPDRIGNHDFYNPLTELKRSYLDRTKLHIRLNYDLLKIITSSSDLNPHQKIVWLSFYTRCYKNYMLRVKEDSKIDRNNNDYDFSFISSYKELADKYSINTKHLSKSIRALEKLGFIKCKNFYIRNKNEASNCIIAERQDKSLWKFTLSLPEEHIITLENVKNRANLVLQNTKISDFDNKTGHNKDCLIINGTKLNLDAEQSSLCKSLIKLGNINELHNQDIIEHSDFTNSESYIDSFIEELDAKENSKYEVHKKEYHIQQDTGNTVDNSYHSENSLSSNIVDNKYFQNKDINSDPHVAKSGLLLNKDIKIKTFKSNLRGKSKVIFNDFLNDIGLSDSTSDVNVKKQNTGLKKKEFSITAELVRRKLRDIPKDKADKARKYAYSIVSKRLAKGYAANLDKHELAKQLIFHISTWKPTKLGNIGKEREIDTALSIAWKAISNGTWQAPLEYAKAEIMDLEFSHYREKYLRFGILSPEIRKLEIETDKLFEGFSNLTGEIEKAYKKRSKDQKTTVQKDHNIDDRVYHLYEEECELDPFTYFDNEKDPNSLGMIDSNSNTNSDIVLSTDVVKTSTNIAVKNKHKEGFVLQDLSNPFCIKQVENDDFDMCFSEEFTQDQCLLSAVSTEDKDKKLKEFDIAGQCLDIDDLSGHELSYIGNLEQIFVNDTNGDIHVSFSPTSLEKYISLRSNIMNSETKLLENLLKRNSNCDQKKKLCNTDISSFTQIDISQLAEEQKVYRIYGLTEGIAFESVNSKTFIFKKVEMSTYDDKFYLVLKNY